MLSSGGKIVASIGVVWIALCVLSAWGKTASPLIPVFEIEDGVVLGILGHLFVIALFVERALEVFVTAARPERGTLVTDVARAKETLAETEAALKADEGSVPATTTQLKNDFAQAKQDLTDKQADLDKYRDETRRIVQPVSLAAGILVAMAGVRSLDTMYSFPDCATVPAYFVALDIILTGGLIGGGSDALHSLVKAFTDGLDGFRAKAKS